MDKIINDLLKEKLNKLTADINHDECAARRHQGTVDMFKKKIEKMKEQKKAIAKLIGNNSYNQTGGRSG